MVPWMCLRCFWVWDGAGGRLSLWDAWPYPYFKQWFCVIIVNIFSKSTHGYSLALFCLCWCNNHLKHTHIVHLADSSSQRVSPSQPPKPTFLQPAYLKPTCDWLIALTDLILHFSHCGWCVLPHLWTLGSAMSYFAQQDISKHVSRGLENACTFPLAHLHLGSCCLAISMRTYWRNLLEVVRNTRSRATLPLTQAEAKLDQPTVSWSQDMSGRTQGQSADLCLTVGIWTNLA